ncbi:MAG: hypothetical protein NW202_06985 [Nitrospira sp.]|nr:hypothetical protein [Nitrospira sp.]
MTSGGIPLSEWSGSGATRKLHETIRDFNEVASRQTQEILKLTRVIAFLTLVMTVGLIVQVFLAWR